LRHAAVVTKVVKICSPKSFLLCQPRYLGALPLNRNRQRPFDEMLLVLVYPIRRAVLESLWEREHSFDELTRICEDHGKLGYHLRRMRATVRRDPDSGAYQLTDQGRLAYEWLTEASSDYGKRRFDLEVSPEHTPLRYVDRLGIGDHALALYSDSALRRDLVFRFLRAGMSRGMAAIYLVPEQRVSRESKEMRARYADTDELEKKGAFTIMSAEEWYMRAGKASPDIIIENWLKLAQEKARKGYKGLQAAGEMNVFFDDAKISELIAYERKLGRKLAENLCGMCIYQAARLQPEQVTSLIEVHGHGIFEGIGLDLSESS